MAKLSHDARASLVTTAATVVGGFTAYSVAPLRGHVRWVGVVMGVLAVGVIVPLTLRRAKAIATSERPMFDAAETLVLLFTLLVYGFASMYEWLAQWSHQMAEVHTKIDALYFTLTTLSTVGFGDAHAVGQAARFVVSIQIVFDLVFLAVAVRLLTSVAQKRAAERDGNSVDA